MPQLGESVTEGTIERWLVKEGDTVEQYDPLFEVVTDKVNAEVPAEVAGTITKIMVPDGAELYANACGETLARAHARAGDRVAIAAYLGSSDRMDRALAEFAVAYADQNDRDYAAFRAAIDSGRLEAAATV